MRKLIVTTVCTLTLTLSGMFGANQITSNIDNTSVENSYKNTSAQTTSEINVSEKSNVPDATTNQVASVTGDTYKTAVLGATSTNNATKTTAAKSKKVKAKKKTKKTKKIVLSNGTKQKTTTTNTATTTNTGTTTKAPTTTSNTGSGSTSTKNTTTKAPTTNTTTSTSNTGISGYANQVLQLVNQERAKEGLQALSMTTPLNNAANKRAQETIQSFSHTRPNGTSFSTVFQEFSISYRTSGENLAYGQKTPQEVVTGWMNSPGHRANIMNGNFGKIGIGVVKSSSGVIYWSQLFTN